MSFYIRCSHFELAIVIEKAALMALIQIVALGSTFGIGY